MSMNFEQFLSYIFVATVVFLSTSFLIGGILSLFDFSREEDKRLPIDFSRY